MVAQLFKDSFNVNFLNKQVANGHDVRRTMRKQPTTAHADCAVSFELRSEMWDETFHRNTQNMD